MKVKVKQVVKYGGHSKSDAGVVKLTLKAMYDELKNTMLLQQALNCDIDVKAKLAGQKPMKLGVFRLKQCTIDGDGESRVQLNGNTDFIEMDNLDLLPLKQDDSPLFTVLYEAEIEEDGENADE